MLINFEINETKLNEILKHIRNKEYIIKNWETEKILYYLVKGKKISISKLAKTYYLPYRTLQDWIYLNREPNDFTKICIIEKIVNEYY